MLIYIRIIDGLKPPSNPHTKTTQKDCFTDNLTILCDSKYPDVKYGNKLPEMQSVKSKYCINNGLDIKWMSLMQLKS